MLQRKKLGWFVYFILVFSVAYTAFRRPAPTFDRYLYAAALAAQRTSDVSAIHQDALAQEDWGYPHTAFSDDVIADPVHMTEQVPFYAIRPLYLLVLRFLPLALVSPLAYAGIAIVLAAWTRRPLFAGLLALSPPLIDATREITPDALSAMFVLGAMWLAWKRNPWSLVVLLAATWIRTDNVLFVLGVLVWFVLERRVSMAHAATLGLIAILGVVVINAAAGSYGWRVLLAHSRYGGFVAPGEHAYGISLREYFSFLRHGLTGMLVAIAPWALMGVLAWKDHKVRPLLLVGAFYVVAHVLIFPIPENRYFLPAYLLADLALVTALTAHAEQDRRMRPAASLQATAG